MLKALCRVARAPLRATASDSSEMVSELLFGEEVTLLQKEKNWAKVKCSWDDYIGWVDYFHLIEKQSSDRQVVKVESPFLDCKVNKESFRLPMGANLQKEGANYFLEQLPIEINGLEASKVDNPVEKLIQFAELFLNTPYLWGGRSCFGIDCSGLTQICHSLIDIPLNRDASQQILQGIEVEDLENRKRGDLAFFQNEKGKISHVGILTSKDQIIHASSWVRIDQFDQEGIYNEQRKIYTHKLVEVRRYIV